MTDTSALSADRRVETRQETLAQQGQEDVQWKNNEL